MREQLLETKKGCQCFFVIDVEVLEGTIEVRLLLPVPYSRLSLTGKMDHCCTARCASVRLQGGLFVDWVPQVAVVDEYCSGLPPLEPFL